MTVLDEQVFAAARVVRGLHAGFGRFVRVATIFLGAIALGVLASAPFMDWPDYFLGLGFLIASPAVLLVMLERYAHGMLAENTSFTEDAAIVLADDTDFPAFLGRLMQSPRVQYLLLKLGLHQDLLNKNIVRTRNQLIVAAKDVAKDRRVDVGDLILLALLESPAALQAIEVQKLTKEDLIGILSWEREREASQQPWGDPLDPKNLILTGGFAKDWAAGYTLLLDRYSTDLTQLFADRRTRLHIVGHQRIIDELAGSLSKSSKSNVILVGDPGVGKKTAVLGFAQAVYRGKTLADLSWKHVKMVDLAHLTAGADPETIELRLTTVLNEAARAGNVILFLDDIEMVLGGMVNSDQRTVNSRVSGVVDASAVLAKFLESSQIQIIATTTYDAYHKAIERNPILVKEFEKIEVGEPTLAEVNLITLDASVGIENEYRVLVTMGAVKSVVTLAERYLHDSPFPEKALDLLEEVAVFASRQSGDKLVLPHHVEEVVHRKTDIPVADATGRERNILLGLEDRLHRRIVNQKEAIAAVSDALRRARAGLKERGKPIGTFLFLGPTGVGKTETAKAVTEAYFGSESHMIRLDMNEYVQADSAQRFQEQLTTRAKEDPYTLVLLDEIEKADQAVMNLLLRLLDEGKIADTSGKLVDLTNTIVVATSNAGAEQIREAIKGRTSFEGMYDELKTSLLDHLQKQRIFSPEFLNRFDGVILFQPLTPEQIGQVVELMLNRLNVQLREQGVQVKLDPAAMQRLAQVGYDPVFGARALRRTVQERVENVVAKKILAGQAQRGSVVTLTAQDI